MRHGGGATAGASILTRTVEAVVPAAGGDVVAGLEIPHGASLVDTGAGRLSVHTVVHFRAIIDDPYTFGKIAANHALGDIYATGAEPQTALAIATLPWGIEAKVEADLSQMMVGANEVLREAQCALIGGRTSEGAELALGFAISGLVERDAVLLKGGLRPGDVLILTKAIGTGALLAAHLRGRAKARWVMLAIGHMIQSNRAAARILREHGASAATGVTSFGLFGHLVEMARVGGVDATRLLARVPLLEGFRESLAAGILSALQPRNAPFRDAIRNLEAASSHLFYRRCSTRRQPAGCSPLWPGSARIPTSAHCGRQVTRPRRSSAAPSPSRGITLRSP